MSEESEVVTEEWEEDSPDSSSLSIEDLAEEMCAVFQKIVDSLDVEAEVSVYSIEGNDIHLAALGNEEEGGLLIGRRGQTLEAIQILIGAIAVRKTDRRVRVFLDAFGYRQRRTDALRQMAFEVADQVRAAGQEALTEPLNAAERRVIHTALQDEEGITTYSEGQEPNRYVVISPAEPLAEAEA